MASSSRKPWTEAEGQAMSEILEQFQRYQKAKGEILLRDEPLYQKISEILSGEGIHRSPGSCKNFWNRYGRTRYGWDEKRGEESDRLRATSTQPKKISKNVGEEASSDVPADSGDLPISSSTLQSSRSLRLPIRTFKPSPSISRIPFTITFKASQLKRNLGTMRSSDDESVLSELDETMFDFNGRTAFDDSTEIDTMAAAGASQAPPTILTQFGDSAPGRFDASQFDGASFQFEASPPGQLKQAAHGSKSAQTRNTVKGDVQAERQTRKTRAAAPQYQEVREDHDQDMDGVSGFQSEGEASGNKDQIDNLRPQRGQTNDRARTQGVPTSQRGRPSRLASTFSKHALPNQPDDRNYLKMSKKDHWSNPGTPSYDPIRMLMSDECLRPDNLLRRPDPNFTYFDGHGDLRPAPHLNPPPQSAATEKLRFTDHPKYAEHIKNRTSTKSNLAYYESMPKDIHIPLAGKAPDSDESGLVLLDLSEVRARDSDDFERAIGSKEHQLTNAVQEEAFAARPSIHLPVPDHIKAILVDDWENVTKNQQLVPLPAAHSVESILDDYMAAETPKRQTASQIELLKEVVEGLKEYFDKCLGRILLYRFERQQYLEVREGWNAAGGDLAGKNAVSTYGAEHFCRLLVSLPELIAQTNMDQQSCNRLCQEISMLTMWIGRNATSLFVREYETPGTSYIEKARSG